MVNIYELLLTPRCLREFLFTEFFKITLKVTRLFYCMAPAANEGAAEGVAGKAATSISQEKLSAALKRRCIYATDFYFFTLTVWVY
jgi:hypothetical protein